MTAMARAVDDLFRQGYACIALGRHEADVAGTCLREGSGFFELPADGKLRHSGADSNYGYRPTGIEYSITPERPDCNESFTLWAGRLDLIPGAADIEPFTTALLAWQAVCSDLTTELLDGCAARFSATAPRFAVASHLQFNNYLPAPAGREFLQERHEDGHMVTLLHARGSGLEFEIGGEMRPVVNSPDQVLVLAGSVLTALTGGAVAPLYHQVRRTHAGGRRSIMYFVNPELAEPLFPWTGEQRDLRDYVRAAPLAFGLPMVEEL
ncbi:2OG-Fe(II) oxygenase family protein [Streptomyces sp. NPDC091377]|uniref:2OG-Fe(II) oxygenase family protein n=1 Tax=Streptomyces sp. NPDC091377 TaxID=3365995 RepID=UPI003812D886